MRKLNILALSAAALLALAGCGGNTPVSSESKSTESSSIMSTSVTVESSDVTTESSDVTIESSNVTTESSEETSESSEETSESSEESMSSEESSESSEESSESSEESVSSEESSEELDVNDGTLEHPFTVTEGYTIASTLEGGADAGAQYFIKGVVSGTISFYKGRVSFDLVDDTSSLYVYNMNNSENKASYKDGDYDFAVGDEIIVAGTFKNYIDKSGNSKLEICYIKDVADCYKAG